MSDRPFDRDSLFDDAAPDERERLAPVDARLRAAGPPPELTPALAVPPTVEQRSVVPFPRRYRAAAIGLAAAVAVVLFVVGYSIGRGAKPDEAFTVPMTGARGASADLVVYTADPAGNWPMLLRVRGLPPLPGTRRYELWLTREGRLVESCGTFEVAPGETEVPLNAPYRLRDFDGWVVVVGGTSLPVLRTATV